MSSILAIWTKFGRLVMFRNLLQTKATPWWVSCCGNIRKMVSKTSSGRSMIPGFGESIFVRFWAGSVEKFLWRLDNFDFVEELRPWQSCMEIQIKTKNFEFLDFGAFAENLATYKTMTLNTVCCFGTFTQYFQIFKKI